MSMEFCSDASPVFFKLLDFSIAPPLLYYAYIPVVVFTLWLAIRSFLFDRKDKQILLFSSVSLSLSFYSLIYLLLWIAAPVWLVRLSWQLWGISSAFLFLSTFQFVYTLIYNKELHKYVKYTLYGLLLPIIGTIFTKLNINGFDYENCEATQSNIGLSYVYAYLGLIFGSLVYLYIKSIFKPEAFALVRKRVSMILLSAITFIAFFMLTAIWGDAIGDYRIEMIAPIGTILFLIGVSYITMDNRKISANILGAEMLVVVLTIIMGSILLVQDISYVHKVTYGSLFFVGLIGYFLIKSVKNEYRQRMQIEELVIRLRETNRILSHDVKGALGKHAMLFRALSQGDFGPVPEQAKGFIEQSAKDAVKLIDSIMVILQSGHEVKFHPVKFDIGLLVKEVAESSREEAKKKGLEINVAVDNTIPLIVDLDQAYIKMHVVQNLISNAINYTLSGHIDVNVEHAGDGMILLEVKDTGVGISPEDAPKMFKEAGHGEHSTEVNVHSTGYGLFSAKRIVDACGGKIWFTSAGIPGKGTTFYVELPNHVLTTEEKVKEIQVEN